MKLLERIRATPVLASAARILAAPLFSCVLVARGLVDRRYYGKQLERRFLTNWGAGAHFVRRGIILGYAPSQRYEPGWVAQVADVSLVDGLIKVVRRGRAGVRRASGSLVEPRRVVDVLSPLTELPESVVLDQAVTPTRRAEMTDLIDRRRSALPPMDWDVDPGVTSAWSGLDWSSVAAIARDPELVSILIPTYNDWTLTTRAVDSVLAHSADVRVEVIVIDNSTRSDVGRLLRGLFVDREEVTIISPGANLNFAGASNLALARSRGARVVFFNNDAEAQEGWLAPLLERLAADDVVAVQPLLVFPSGLIQAAGTVFTSSTEFGVHFLVDHHVADLDLLDPAALRGFSALTAACVAMAADDVIALQGFDEEYVNGMEDVDLFLRQRRRDSRRLDVVRESVVMHREGATPSRIDGRYPNRHRYWLRWLGEEFPDDRWRLAGLGMAGWVSLPLRESTNSLPTLLSGTGRRLLRVPGGACRVALRGPDGGRDLVERLAAALRERGAHVLVDDPSTVNRESAWLDDVVVHFSSDDHAMLQVGAHNVGIEVDALAFPEALARGLEQILDGSREVDALAQDIIAAREARG